MHRKYNEALIAMALEHRLSKQDIFALYCNEVYSGRRGGVGVRGIAQAARVYFGKALKDISLAEAATIAGMIQSPGRYSPERNPDATSVRLQEFTLFATRLSSSIADLIGTISVYSQRISSCIPLNDCIDQSIGLVWGFQFPFKGQTYTVQAPTGAH